MGRMFNPPHPGEVLREFLPDDMTIEEVARRLAISRVQLSRILNGRSAISADMAIRIGLLTNRWRERLAKECRLITICGTWNKQVNQQI
jgi:addiction module HigA family antidote